MFWKVSFEFVAEILKKCFKPFYWFIGHAALTLRSRLRCIIVRRPGSEDKEYKPTITASQDNYTNSCPKPSTNILVLNEVVIDRGPSPYLSNIDLFLDGKHITSVQGDGLIVSTPTGSTAYAVAAGASMIRESPLFVKISQQAFNIFQLICRSVRAGNNGDTNLSSFVKFSPNRSSSWSWIEDFHFARQPKHLMGIVWWSQSSRTTSRRQVSYLFVA